MLVLFRNQTSYQHKPSPNGILKQYGGGVIIQTCFVATANYFYYELLCVQKKKRII